MSLNSRGIKNLLFDFGGVILDIDYNAVRQAFEVLGMKDVKAFYQHEDHGRLVMNMEKGVISENDFRDAIINELPEKISYRDFDAAWNAILKTVPPQRVRLLENLAKEFNLYLLSNTNIIHYRKYNDEFEQSYGKSLTSLFEKAYFSHEIKMRKPSEDIFTFVVKDAGIAPGQTLFVDDSELNISAAERVGLQTLYKPQEDELTDYFSEYL